MTVSCAKCGAPATSLMSFAYAECAVWLDDITELNVVEGYVLCSDHADRMTPPQGWTLTDRRNVTRLFAPVQVA